MSTQSIPLSNLEVSPDNARKTFSKSGIKEMQASLLAHGLMQNLVVTAGEKGRYYVVAGARRLTAFQALSKEGKVANDLAIRCEVVEEDKASGLSLDSPSRVSRVVSRQTLLHPNQPRHNELIQMVRHRRASESSRSPTQLRPRPRR